MDTGERLLSRANIKAYRYALKWIRFEMKSLNPYDGYDWRMAELTEDEKIIEMLLSTSKIDEGYKDSELE
jgi:hypothetical protein